MAQADHSRTEINGRRPARKHHDRRRPSVNRRTSPGRALGARIRQALKAVWRVRVSARWLSRNSRPCCRAIRRGWTITGSTRRS